MKPIARNSRPKRGRGGKPPRGRLMWMGAAVLAAAALVGGLVGGCSPSAGPEEVGTISLSLHEKADDEGQECPMRAPLAVDSIVVRVFRAGSGAKLETSKGVPYDGSSDVQLTVTCVAEAGKKVSVELFDHARMMYFGAAEDVEVNPLQDTDVAIDAWDIFIDRLQVEPQLVTVGTPFEVRWSSVAAPGGFLLQESGSADFSTVVNQILTADTTVSFQRGTGAHYFRVAPVNEYAVGTVTPPAFCYVAETSEPAPTIDAIEPAEAAPTERVTIRGSKLDLPGSQVLLGQIPCPIISATDASMLIQIPRAGHTGRVTLKSILGEATAPDAFVVNRIAYVTRGGEYAEGYRKLITADSVITGGSGVEVVVNDHLCTRDMSVFDLVVVGHDNGTEGFVLDAAQAGAIIASGSQIMAIGAGGYMYLRYASAEVDTLTMTASQRQDLYVPDPALPVFVEPYPIVFQIFNFVRMCDPAQYFIGIDVTSKPKSITLYANFFSGSRSWALLDVLTSENSIRNFFWGYTGDPGLLTTDGKSCFLNVLNLLLAGTTADSATASNRAD
jgi:hypothetical protein